MRCEQSLYFVQNSCIAGLQCGSFNGAALRPHHTANSLQVLGNRGRCQRIVASTAALDKEKSSNRYVDLRSLKTVRWEEASLSSCAVQGCSFGPFDHPCEDAHHDIPPDVLFSHETIPLSQSQRDVVRAILSRRSVLYNATSAEWTQGIVFDLALRASVWQETILYCAPSRRAAEAMYIALRVQFGPERSDAVVLDTGDANCVPSLQHFLATTNVSSSISREECYESSNPEEILGAGLSSEGRQNQANLRGENGKHNADIDSPRQNGPSIIITLPAVLQRHLVSPGESTWMKSIDAAILDNINADDKSNWEEILLCMPSSVVVCMIANDMTISEREQLLLWFETVQNSVVPVAPLGGSSLLDRINRCVDLPILRTFIYNAAVHTSPIQLSLPLLLEMIQKRSSSTTDWTDTDYSSALLRGVTVLEAMPTGDLLFSCTQEAEYADFVSVMLQDAKKTSGIVREKLRKKQRATRKKRTASSMATAKKRREAAQAESSIFPVMVFVHGSTEAESAANALLSAAEEEVQLLWDEDSAEYLGELLAAFEKAHGECLGQEERDYINLLSCGIGVIHNRMLPSLRVLAEELFRTGFILALFVDTHLTYAEMVKLPSAKTVILQSTAMAALDDASRGLVKGSTAAALAGRLGKDDAGNLIVMWYDESVDDIEAAGEVASSLVIPLLSETGRVSKRAYAKYRETVACRNPIQSSLLDTILGPHRIERSSEALWSSYAGVLRSLRRFGLDGYKTVLEYTADSYQGWLVKATLRATREKMELEKQAIDEKLDTIDWSEIANHDRREAKLRQSLRVLNAMKSHESIVRAERVFEAMKVYRPGSIIGLRLQNTDGAEVKALTGDQAGKEVEDTNENKSAFGGQNSASKSVGIVDHESTDARHKSASKLNDPLMLRTSKYNNEYQPAVFVAIIDRTRNSGKSCPLEAEAIVICILMDGMWTMVPSSDVVALGKNSGNEIANVDLLEVPHLATFDLDPVLGWAKCNPVTETETAALERISDELIARITSSNVSLFKELTIPEFESQKARVASARRSLQISPWFGKEEQLAEIRSLRRRAAKLSDDAISFQKTESHLERLLNGIQEGRTNLQRSRLAVLEDCNAVRIHSEVEMEMTPIGALASVLPGPFPLFSAACLLLIDGTEKLSPPQLVAFVAVSSGLDEACAKSRFSSFSKPEEATQSSNHQFSDERSPPLDVFEVDDLDEVLPIDMLHVFDEILRALHMLQQRHFHSKVSGVESYVKSVSEIAPRRLSVRCARPAYCFSKGDSWRDVLSLRGVEPGELVAELRTITEILAVIAAGGAIGEFGSHIRERAGRALRHMQKWPIQDVGDFELLIRQGVVQKEWNSRYEEWWRSEQQRVRELVSSVKECNTIQTVDAEVVE